MQFVIEFVGPRSLSAGSAAALLSPEWQAALGNPQAFCMSAADVQWAPLTATSAGSYDSLALAWDLVTFKGQLSKQTAQHLLQTAEQFAQHIQRRAMAMPVPEDVPKALSHLKQVEQNFDAGVSILVLANSQEVSEFELWVWCAKLGLTPNLAEGTYDWIVPGSHLPLFSVSPVGDTESFTLEGAERGDKHEGVLLGFSIPRSPEPMAGLEGMFKAAAYFAEKMWGQVYDENNQPLTDAGKQTMRTQLAQAVDSLQRLGFPPGSSDCLRLFQA
ncbi:MAG TPA: cell division protein ZipA C-terminal FtsZ-binding domain-containing protein [Fimbriimonadaceae bacterium]|nr:cell division protein ZipA C-terminal FtsZ-binding domain-containing protein [Fimbriimonadaceae bacterium]